MVEASKRVVLVVDDEPLKRATLRIDLASAGFTVVECADVASAVHVLGSRRVDAIVSDIRMPEIDGMQFLEQVKSRFPNVHVILMTAYGSVSAAVDAIKRGAYDYITKPFDSEVLVAKLNRLISSQSVSHDGPKTEVRRAGRLVGRCFAMQQLFDQVAEVAAQDRPVLIQGESGTRRDQVAEAIHQLGPRSGRPFVEFNCSASTPEGMEVELFGASAPSGSDRAGCLERAQVGTLFLDDIEALPQPVQGRFLLALERGTYERTGSSKSLPLTTRIICGTKQDLRRLVESGMFRADLQYRIAALTLTVPSLRDRTEDIPILVAELLQDVSGVVSESEQPLRIDPHVMDMLMRYHWPGNLRELEHVIERARTTMSGDLVRPGDIHLPADGPQPMPAIALTAAQKAGLSETIAGVERSLIEAALRKVSGNQAKAAAFLRIPRTTLRDKMAKYGMVIKTTRD